MVPWKIRHVLLVYLRATALCGCVCALGCGVVSKPLARFAKSESDGVSDPHVPAPSSRAKVKDHESQDEWLGEVMSGEVVTRSFRYLNTTGSRLHLRDDAIRPSCGCTNVRVLPRQLDPGQTAEVNFSVNTRTKSGRFEESVELGWIAPEGSVQRVHFRLSGIAVPPLVFDPPLLSFANAEVRSGRRKRVRCSSDLPLEWRSARVIPSHPYVHIENWKVCAEGEAVTFEVACDATDSGDFRRAQVRIDVPQLQPKGLTARHDEVASAELSVLSDDLQGLRVSPSELKVRWKAAHGLLNGSQSHGKQELRNQHDSIARRGVATLVVSGDEIRNGLAIESVRVGTTECVWEATSIGSEAIKLRVHLESPPSVESLNDQFVVLELSDGTKRTVAFR